MLALKRHAKRVALEGLGWILVLVGLAALVLPGPGLLALFAGLVLLSTQYEWAERRVEPVQKAALRTAAESVQTWPRIAASSFFAAVLVAAGIVWGLHPETPGWWPIAAKWWLVGGWSTGIALIVSGMLALSMIIYSYQHFHPKKLEK